MKESDYAPTERTADRAVELWKRMLHSPKYDNVGDTGSPKERATQRMASMLAATIPSNATEDVLDAFGVELKRLLLDDSLSVYSRSSLGVDYGPDKLLSDAAAVAGLKMEFPWKTNMSICCAYVSVSSGYGAECVYHYPLDDGRWLVTTLNGSDISKVIEYAIGGAPTFDIEDNLCEAIAERSRIDPEAPPVIMGVPRHAAVEAELAKPDANLAELETRMDAEDNQGVPPSESDAAARACDSV